MKYALLLLLFFVPTLAHASYATTTTTTLGGDTTFGGTSSNTAAGTPFWTGAAGTMGSITADIVVRNSPVDHVVANIYADSNGSNGTPTGSSLGTSNNFDPGGTSTDCTNPNDVSITWASPPSLTANTRYWIVFTRTGSLNSTNNYLLCGKQPSVKNLRSGQGTSATTITNADGATDDIQQRMTVTITTANSCTYGGSGAWTIKYSDNCYITGNTYVKGACYFLYDAAGSFGLAGTIGCNKLYASTNFKVNGLNGTARLYIR